MNKDFVVSVCMITYNHEKYITEAINGVLSQDCDFKLELILVNDCSSDNTELIIYNIIKNHPKSDSVKYFKHDKNVGVMPNFTFALKQCKGKYIAICDGDDYWTDSLKLQKQVDFLEKNLDYSICFHKVKVLQGDTLLDDVITEARYNKIKELPASVDDLIEHGNFMNTASVVYRNYNIKFPFEFNYSTVGDYFLHIINAQNGYIKQLDEFMSVYRKGVGVYSILSEEKMLEKIIIYQTCILSYLSNNAQKELLLDKTIKNILKLREPNINQEHLSSILSYKSLLKIALLKIKKIKL